MALQFLEYLGLEVGVIEDCKYFQDTLQGGAAVPLGVAFQVVCSLLEQVFQPQESPYTFVERLLIENFRAYRGRFYWFFCSCRYNRLSYSLLILNG